MRRRIGALDASFLFARLQLARPGLRQVLVVPASLGDNASFVACELAEAIADAGQRVGLISLPGQPPGVPGSKNGLGKSTLYQVEMLQSELVDSERIRRALDSQEGFTIALGGPVQSDAWSLRLASIAHAVVFVARAGKTYRTDLLSARVQAAEAGDAFLGCVLTR